MSRLRIGLAAGAVLLVLGGAAGLWVYLRTPAVILNHADPHSLAPMPVGDEKGPLAAQTPSQQVLQQNSPYQQQVPTEPKPSAPPRRTGLWIEMPQLQIALPIQKGDGTDNVPQWVALTFPGTAPPGSPGNSYIYAHGLWGMFGALLFARTGDAVHLHNYDTNSDQTFHITKIVGKVSYGDTHWINEKDSKPVLTLQTCIDFNPKSDRYIVQAS